MTAPAAPSGGRSPLRIGGLALLAVAVIAALIGIGTLVIGPGDDDNQATGPTPTATPAPGDPQTGAPQTGGTVTLDPTTGEVVPPVATTAPPEPVPSPAPLPPADGSAPGDGGAGSGGAGAGSGGDGAGGGSSGGGGGSGGDGSGGGNAQAVRAPLRVYNNSTISGLATDAATDFRAAGWSVEEVANYPFGIIPTTTVYYRPGTAEQAPADQLGAETGIRVEPRFEGLRDATPGLIVIVTNDYDQR